MPSPDVAHALSEGTVVNGRYRIEEVLGAGAFGITYRVTDMKIGGTRVIKELYPEDYRLARGGAAISIPTAKEEQHRHSVKRVLKQGHLLRTLEHPNLMSVHRAFEANGTAYLEVEHLEGASLRERLDEKGTLSETEVWDLIEEVGGGLSALHEEGMLHLDVKPDNIVKASGRYVVIDYGAGRMNSEEESIELSTGAFTPEYAAIEQTDDSFEKGPYTDLYAVGVTAYECLTGERPPRSAARLMREDRSLTWPEGVDTNLKGALEEVLQIEPEDRPKSVKAWLSEPVTEEMPPAGEGGDGSPAYGDVRGDEGGLQEWMPSGRVATASLPILALGILLVGLEWGGVTQLGERFYAGAGNPSRAVGEDTTRETTSEPQGGTQEQLEARRKGSNETTQEESTPNAPTKPAPKSKGQVESEMQEGGSEAASPMSNGKLAEESPSAEVLTRRGDSLKAEGQLPAALKSYTQAVEVDSSRAEAWKGRGDVLKEQDRLEAAVESFERAVAEDSSYTSSLVTVLMERGGELYDFSQKKKTRRAVKKYRRIDELAPPKQIVLYKLFRSLLFLGRSEAASKVYKRAINLWSTREDSSPAAWAVNTDANQRVDVDPEETIKRYNLLVEVIPSYENGWAWRGDFLREQGQLDEALQSYNRALKLDSSNSDFWEGRGEILRKQGRLDEALASYDQALSRDSTHRAWYRRGKVLEEQRRPGEALDSYTHAVEDYPSFAKAWKARGDVLADQGRFDLAAQSYERALREGGIELPTQDRLLEAALERYNRLLEADSSYTAVWQLRGDVLQKLGRSEVAIQSYDRAVELAPTSADVWKKRGDVLMQQEQFEAAVQSYDRAVGEDSTYASSLVEALNDRAGELEEQGQYEAALMRYNRALRVAKFEFSAGEAWNGRGRVLQQLGQFKEAVKNYNKACTLDTDYCSTYSSLKGSGQGLNSGAIRGTVLDETGEPISDVTVAIIHQSTGAEWYTTTTADGQYTFADLHIGGPYTLRAKFKWHRPAERTGIMLEIDDQQTIDLERQTGQE